MRKKHVIVGVNSKHEMLVLGDSNGKPFDDPRRAEKARTIAADEHKLFEVIVLEIQAGPRF